MWSILVNTYNIRLNR